MSGAAGSAYGEFAKTRVIVSIFGPRPRDKTAREDPGDSNPLGMQLDCQVHLPFYRLGEEEEDQGATGTADRADPVGAGETASERERRLAKELEQCILPSIQQEKLPKTCVEIQCTILETDGREIGPAIMCASFALAAAEIPLYDLVTYCTLVSLDNQILLDPTLQELQSSECEVSLAYMANRDQINFVRACGEWNDVHSLKESMDTCLDGCKKIQRVMRKCLLDTMAD